MPKTRDIGDLPDPGTCEERDSRNRGRPDIRCIVRRDTGLSHEADSKANGRRAN